MLNPQDIIGQRFDRLLIINVDRNKKGKTVWICKCDCGNITVVPYSRLKSGNTKSCGCLHHDFVVSLKMRHGQAHSRFYNIWSEMKRRCNNPKSESYSRYGGKGIKVCSRWMEDFENFYQDMFLEYQKHVLKYGENETQIDRIDSKGDYCPDNCRWATIEVQQNNKSSCKYITFNNETHTISQWAIIKGINLQTLVGRLNRNWSIEDALTLPTGSSPNFAPQLIEYKGERHTIAEWSQITGIPKCSLSSRIFNYRWSVERALTEPNATRKPIPGKSLC